MTKSIIVRTILVCSLLCTSGCGTLIGNTGPVDEKSQSYSVIQLSKENPDWERIEPKEPGKKVADKASTETSDVAYQSKSTSSVISLYSSCRTGQKPSSSSSQKDLHSLSEKLFMGATDVTLRDEQGLTVQGTPALETTFRGRINGKETAIQAVVLRREPCIYNFVYASNPASFESEEKTFKHFVESFRFR